jgi:hypothetical protein
VRNREKGEKGEKGEKLDKKYIYHTPPTINALSFLINLK